MKVAPLTDEKLAAFKHSFYNNPNKVSNPQTDTIESNMEEFTNNLELEKMNKFDNSSKPLFLLNVKSAAAKVKENK